MSDLDDLDYKPRRPWWILVVVALVVILAGVGVAAAFLLEGPTARPQRLLLGVEVQLSDGTRAGWWDGEEGAAGAATVLHDGLHDALQELGLDVVARTSDGLVSELAAAETLEARRAVALDHEALWYVPIVVEVTSVSPIGEGGTHVEVVAQPHLQIVPTLDDTTPVEVPEPLRFRAYATDEVGALRRMQDDLPAWGGPDLVATLVDRPALARLRGGDGLELEEAAVAASLGPLFEYLKYREASLSNHEQRAAEAAANEIAANLPPDARIGDWHGWTSPLGFGPDGTILVKDDQLRIDLPLGKHKLEVEEIHETVARVSADGASWDRLLDAYNFYSHPDVSADGSTLVAIAEQRGMSMAIEILDTARGEIARPLVSSTLELSGPRLSRDGEKLFFWATECRDCEAVGQVMDVSTGAYRPVVRLAGRNVTFPDWAPDGGTLYYAATGARGGQDLIAANPADASERVILTAGRKGIASVRDVWAHPDGDLIASVRTDTSEFQIVRVDPATGAVQVLFEGPHDDVAVSPDGERLAVEIRGGDGWDVYVVDLADQGVTQLTRAPMNEQVVGWTGDSGAVLFYIQHYEQESKRRYTVAYRVPAP